MSACIFGDDDDPAEDEPTPSVAAPTATPSPSPSPTPDPLATPPASQIDARAWLQLALGPSRFDPPCPERLGQAGVACARGDADGDGLEELAYLVPVRIPGSQLPYPATVFIRNGQSQKLDELAIDLTADASILGFAFFAFEDRTGDGDDDLSYLRNVCGITGCRTLAVVQTWDGTAWRDIGPGDNGINNVDRVEWEGTGEDSSLVIHGGKLPASAPTEAGPSRAATTTYVLDGPRYSLSTVEPDPPEYLYHALLDAEAIFATNIEPAKEAYEAIVNDDELLDWQIRPGQDRRPSLRGLALFRLALISAALQESPVVLTAALDRVILESKEPLFVNVAQEFRRGYNERGGLIGGCAAVNLYLSAPVAGTDTRGYVEQLFNYGYNPANPAGSTWIARICPF